MTSLFPSPASRRSTARRWMLALVVATGLLAGCGAESTDAESDVNDREAGGPTTYPLTLESEFGTTVLDERPERVVALGDLDDVLALGVIPVGSFRPAGDATELYDYEQTALDQARRDGATTEIEELFDPYAELEYEAIAELEPDVIVAAGYWDLGASYDKLAAIAPVVALPEDAEQNWESRHRAIAKALDRADEGEAAIDAVHQAFESAREANPQFADLALTYAVVYPTQVTYMSVPDTEASWFFSQLGFQAPESSSQFGAEYPDDVVSAEQTPLLDADVVVIGYHSLLEPGQREAFEESALFTSLLAVRDGRYLALPEGHDSSIPQPGVLSSLDDLQAVLPLLEQMTAE